MPLSPARAAARIRPHPALRISGSPPSPRIAPTLRSTACRSRPDCGPNRSRRKSWFISSAALGMSAVRRPDGPDGKAQPHPASIAVSANPRRATTMTRSFSSRLQHAPEHQCHACACAAATLAQNLRTILPQTLVARPEAKQFSCCPAFSPLTAIQNP